MFIGVSNQYALYSATLHNAQLAGIGNITGSIEKGKAADMIITDGNPLKDLRTLRTVKMVMANGKLIRNPKISRNKEIDTELDKFIGSEQ
jgi:imidazolonepropionase-like amidohydrolase